MENNKHDKDKLKVLQFLGGLLFLGDDKKAVDKGKKPSKSPDEIKSRVLLKMERAEIMSAMISMRKGDDKDRHL